MNGTEILAEFRNSRAEAAFGELVRRYTNLVYSVAKRRLSNESAAEEITQTVFIRLAKTAPNVRGDGELVAWLHRTTVHASIDLWRSEIRRRAREEQAVAMQAEPTEDAPWNEIAPVLDEVLNQLNDAERQVILLRFFEQRTMRELGGVLGISEDAAKMRVSRAMDHLRGLFSGRGVVCSAVALGALMQKRSVQAAPARLLLTLAELRIPASAGLAGVNSLAPLVVQLAKAKWVGGLALLAVGIAALVWLVSSASAPRVAGPTVGQTGDQGALSEQASATASAVGGTNSPPGPPDPVKLLQAVARARNHVFSGEIEFDVARYDFDRPLDQTNYLHLKVLFEGTQRRVESFAREYAYTAVGADASQAIEARVHSEKLSHEAAVRAGLLQSFDSHHVTAYDGALLLDYWENDGRPQQAKIADPAQGSGTYSFDPRCLGIDISPGPRDTIESQLGSGTGDSAQLVGEELVEGASTWHVRVQRGSSMARDFWLDMAHPLRVVKFAWNGSEVLSKYDDANPHDPLPVEVKIMFLHGTTGSQTAFSYTCFTRRAARFGISVDPASWTLAGLGMKVGTDVIDYRKSRRIGYWTGAGLSESLPPQTAKPQSPPNRTELLAVLDTDPASSTGLEAAQWILLNTPDGPDVNKAAEVILREHVRDTNLAHLCPELERLRPRCATNLLEAMLQRNPSSEVRGYACLALARMRQSDANYGQNRRATDEAISLFERVIGDFAHVRQGGKSLAELAKPELNELRALKIGQPAPKTEGDDLKGQPIRLADYRGKVVLLVFWRSCGGCRPDVPELLKLLKRFGDQSFAILGVFCDDDPAEGKSIAEELGMRWPSLYDAQSGPVASAWNNRGWPTFNIVDAKGIIRYRDAAGIYLAKSLEALLGQ